MRISTPQIFQSGLSAMQSAQARLNHTSLQMATGRRILTPSDDPSGAAQSVQLDAAIKATEQFQRNGDYAQPRLEQEEAQIDAAQNALQRVRELVVTGNNDTYNQENRKILASEIRQLRDHILDLANTKDANGEYLFAGTESLKQPFVAAANGVVSYVGADGSGAVREVAITSTRCIGVCDTGKSVFMAIPEKSGKVVDAVLGLTNTGDLVVQGSKISDPDGFSMAGQSTDPGVAFVQATSSTQPGQYVVNVTQAATQGVLDGVVIPLTIGAAPNNAIQIDVDGVTNNITLTPNTYTDGDALAVEIATQLGAGVSVAYDSVNGFSFTSDSYGSSSNVAITAGSTIVGLDTSSSVTAAGLDIVGTINGQATTGSGQLLTATSGNASGLQLRIADSTTGNRGTVSFSHETGAALTVQFTDASNYAVFNRDGTRALDDSGNAITGVYQEGTAIEFAGRSLTLAGTPNAGDTVTSRPAPYVSVFDTLDAIATALETPSTDEASREALSEASSTALLNLDSSLDRMSDVRASVGMRLQTLDTQAGLNDQRVLDLKTTLSDVRDLDYAEAISRYKLQEVVLQAAQQTYTQVSKLSLFDFL
ncbi:flagellar hook-associated protein FlgL [Thiocystis minor]|uniref:flagellar hook-associated protein FlgL n=1 Tax=Thiocystis minor TaxID=61597 RepID=UPI001F5C3BBE|nr:flagellar hook-associated protein FlgL [Thiocystis minor]